MNGNKDWLEDFFKFDKNVIGKFPDVELLRENLKEPEEYIL